MTIAFLDILLRLTVALVLGAVVGLERESKEHSAGMRTQALVSLGSALFTIISAFGFLSFLGMSHVQIDPTRIASYIVAGIGFLGAGSILMSRSEGRVRGLTTAASVWLVAAVGMACGAGLLLEAIAATILALIILSLLPYLERFLLHRFSQEIQHLYIETAPSVDQLVSSVYTTCARCGITVGKLSLEVGQESDTIKVTCRAPDPTSLVKAIDELRTLTGVRTVQTDLQDMGKKTPVLSGKTDKAS